MSAPKTWPVWWDTGSEQDAQGYYSAEVLGIRPYVGPLSHLVSHVMKLSAPGTERGWLEMSIEKGMLK